MRKYPTDKSGSCAIISLIVNDVLYVGNTGDSRVYISLNKGKNYKVVSVDHKPENEFEK